MCYIWSHWFCFLWQHLTVPFYVVIIRAIHLSSFKEAEPNNFTIFKLFKPTVRKVVKRLVRVALIDLCYVSQRWFEPHEPRHWVTSMQRLKAKTHLTINSKFGRLPLHCDLQQNLFHIQCLELFVHLFQICWLKLLSPTPSSSSNHCHHRQKLAWWDYKGDPLLDAFQFSNLSGTLCLVPANSNFY